MNKKYIETILKSEDMIHKIAVARTQYSRNITYSDFLQIFSEALNTFGVYITIDCNLDASTNDPDISKREFENFINVSQNHEDLIYCKFSVEKINDKLLEYNYNKKEMGFTESTIYLINIFLDILEG